ncbi:unnamed protein product [Urochloa decumbens]|uniref:Uncharacterized protein n=1 Tax=Urochloa decumbens TaxID=240449 RepID=A0ABC8X4S0_9POAL
MPLRQLLLQARRRCSPSPRLPQLSGFLVLCRALSILPSQASAMPPQRRSPPVQVRLPRSSPGSSSDPLGEYPDDLQRHDDEEAQDFDDDIDDMRHRNKLFYKLDQGSKEYEENNMTLRRRRNRDKANAKNPKECKVEPAKSVSSNAPKLKAKRAAREEDMVEVKRERVLTFNQMTDPYHHPFCLDIHVTEGSVRACFVHRVTSRVVAVAHSISKDMKFDLGSRKGKCMKACAAVGAVLAKRAIEDDIHNAVYTPRKGDRIEGKVEVVLRAITDNGVDVKVKLKQRKPIKNTRVVPQDQSPDRSAVVQMPQNSSNFICKAG